MTNISFHQLALPCLALPCLAFACIVGCGREKIADREVFAVLDRPIPPKSSPTVIEHDFGAILASGQVLSHDFLLHNLTDRALGLGKPELTTPCCSAIEAAPTSIPAHGSAPLSIVFRPGFQSGAKRVSFIVPTDSAAMPGFDLRVHADLFGEVEIKPLESTGAAIVANQGGTIKFRVISRSAGTTGRSAPDRLATSGSLAARFVGPAGAQKNLGDIVEVERDVEVSLPASDQIGPQRGEVRVFWPAGRDWAYPIAWDVHPLVSASPAGLILRPDAINHECVVVVRSEDRPIRVVGVEGAALARPAGPFDLTPRLAQTIRLVLDPTQAGAASDIVIQTDHARQPRVAVSVVTPPMPTKERP